MTAMEFVSAGMLIAIGWRVTTHVLDIIESAIGYKVLEYKLGYKKVKEILSREGW